MKQRRRLTISLLASLALSLFLLACGGGGSGDDEAQIEAAIRTGALSTDPSKCTELATPAFLTQTTEKTGKKAVEACEEEAKDPTDNAKSLKFTKIEVDGSKATADTAFTGGGFGGQTVVIALVKDGDQWKLDRLAGFASIDKAALGKTLEERLDETGKLTSKQTSCIVGEVEKASKAKLEELFLSGSSTEFVELVEGCA